MRRYVILTLVLAFCIVLAILVTNMDKIGVMKPFPPLGRC